MSFSTTSIDYYLWKCNLSELWSSRLTKIQSFKAAIFDRRFLSRIQCHEHRLVTEAILDRTWAMDRNRKAYTYVSISIMAMRCRLVGILMDLAGDTPILPRNAFNLWQHLHPFSNASCAFLAYYNLWHASTSLIRVTQWSCFGVHVRLCQHGIQRMSSLFCRLLMRMCRAVNAKGTWSFAQCSDFTITNEYRCGAAWRAANSSLIVRSRYSSCA